MLSKYHLLVYITILAQPGRYGNIFQVFSTRGQVALSLCWRANDGSAASPGHISAVAMTDATCILESIVYLVGSTLDPLT